MLAGLLAFLVYGVWAGYVNSEYGVEIAVRSGLGQGIYAFFSTFFVTAMARRMLVKYGHGVNGIIISFSCSLIVMLAFPLTIHAILRTPDVIEAILPGLIWGTLYIVFVIRLACRYEVYGPGRENPGIFQK